MFWTLRQNEIEISLHASSLIIKAFMLVLGWLLLKLFVVEDVGPLYAGKWHKEFSWATIVGETSDKVKLV